MEIRYKRTYLPPKGKRYTAGEIEALLGCAIEIADPRPKLQAGKLAPGEICMLLFGITPEEYAMKDDVPKELDALAEKLRRELPADRLLGWRVCGLKGATVQRSLTLATSDSIDGGAFAERAKEKLRVATAGPIDEILLESRRLQEMCARQDAPEAVKQDWQTARAALGRAILGLDRIYAACDTLSGGKWPAVGFDGRVELFTRQDRAERAREQIAAANAGVALWTIRELPKAEIEGWLRGCAADGFNGLRVDNGFAATELKLQDVLPKLSSKTNVLRSFMLREIEFGLRLNKFKEAGAPERNLQGALEGMLTFRNFAWRELGNASLYVVSSGGARGKCVVLADKSGKERMLGVFTERVRAVAFAERLAGDAAALEMRFDEIVVRAAAFDGLLIDADTLNYRLPKKEFDQVRELRGKPPMVVRVRPPEQKTPETSAQIRAQSQTGMGELPDPDKFAAHEEQTEAKIQEQTKSESSEMSSEKVNKRGFFKKLFGKQA